MNASFYIKICCALLCLVLLSGALGLSPSAERVTSYTVTMDDPVGITASNMPIVIRDYEHGTDDVLSLEGWIKTDQTIRRYEYTMDGGKTWKRNSIAVKPRPDTKQFNPNTYQTAGFSLDIDVSELPRGYYDLFVRAYTDKEDVIDVLAMINVSIGHVDKIATTYRELNLTALGAQKGTLTLQANEPLMLDAYNLRDFQSFEVVTDQATVLTLQSPPDAALSFSMSSGESVQNEDGTFTATIALDTPPYAGTLILSSTETVQISRMRFYTTAPDYYDGELEVYMTATPFEHLSGANAVDAAIMSDDTVGTYIRLFPAVDTNDPFIYFNLGNYLKETQDVQINADYYRYAVMTLQTPAHNSKGLFRMFVCAGEVRGPTGGVDVHFQPQNDGEWHRYVIPLCDEEMWAGTVYGLRFDFIDGHATTKDYANIASISFHHDEESANAAAAQPYTQHHEQGKAPTDIYKEEGRAPSGRADAITYFDESLADCFSGENQSVVSFDEYGHLILQSIASFNDPFVSFSLQTYSEKTGLPLLRAEDYGVIVLRVLADKLINGKGFTLYYYSGGFDFAQGERTINAAYDGGKWEYLVYEMAGRPAWTDEILGMRLDYAQYISAGQRVCVSDMLFFKDMDAWKAYAQENGIPVEGDDPIEIETLPPTPETEMPTIEIPTQGAGLEYIPPNEFEQDQNSNGCKSICAISICLLLPLAAVTLIKPKHKKGDEL